MCRAALAERPSLAAGLSAYPLPLSYAASLETYTPDKNFCGDLPVKRKTAVGHVISVGGKGLSFGVTGSGGYTVYFPLYTDWKFTPFGFGRTEAPEPK